MNIKKYRSVIIACLAAIAVVVAAEFYMGHSFLGPDGRFGLWEGNIWSSENSQRLADPYSLTHVIDGFLFYALLWLVARKLPARQRFVIAFLLEAALELFENTHFIINRYRQGTISFGYMGDSVLNSVSDMLMMASGFLLATRLRAWVSVAVVAAVELMLLILVRDNLTLNIIMLIHPFEAIKHWQAGGQALLKIKL